MKGFAIILIAVSIAIMCIGCGPYADVAGTYVYRDGNNFTYTVTLKGDGGFRFARKIPKTSSLYGSPLDNDDHNVREGSFTYDNGTISIEFSYYEEAQKGIVHGTAKARIANNKLIISGNDQINGTFTKQ